MPTTQDLKERYEVMLKSFAKDSKRLVNLTRQVQAQERLLNAYRLILEADGLLEAAERHTSTGQALFDRWSTGRSLSI